MRAADLAVRRLGFQAGHRNVDAQSVELGDDAGVAVQAGVLQAIQGVLQIRIVGINTVAQQMKAALAGKPVQ